MKRKPNLMMDALILFVITVLSGLILGGLYVLTKEPIAKAEQNAKDEAYIKVLPAAVKFEVCFENIISRADDLPKMVSEKTGTTVEGVSVSGVVKGINDKGETVGYVVLANSSKSYGGNISLAVGMDEKLVVTGISVLSINDTPGLGMKAKDESFGKQFVGKNTDVYYVSKGSGTDTGKIDAISSATITSKAYTSAVNTAKVFLSYALETEGGTDE